HGGAADFEATVAVEQCGIAAVQRVVVVADLDVRDLRTVGAGGEVLFDLQPVGGEQGRGGFDHLGGAGGGGAGRVGAGSAAVLVGAGSAAGVAAVLVRVCARRPIRCAVRRIRQGRRSQEPGADHPVGVGRVRVLLFRRTHPDHVV